MLDIRVYPSTWDTETLGSEVQSQLWPHRKFEVSLEFRKPYFKKQATVAKRVTEFGV